MIFHRPFYHHNNVLVNLFINLPIQEYIHSTIETFINEYIYILIGECIGKYKIPRGFGLRRNPLGVEMVPMEEHIPTNRSRESRKYKSFERARDGSGRFKKSEEIKVVCRLCGSSNVVKFGYNITKEGKKQRYKCKDCNAKFTPTSKLIKPIKFNSIINLMVERLNFLIYQPTSLNF